MSSWSSSQSLSALEEFPEKDLQAFTASEVHTVGDVLDWFPKRYEDHRRFDAFPAQAGGEAVCLQGTVVDSARNALAFTIVGVVGFVVRIAVFIDRN